MMNARYILVVLVLAGCGLDNSNKNKCNNFKLSSQKSKEKWRNSLQNMKLP